MPVVLPDRVLTDPGKVGRTLHDTTRPEAAEGPTRALGASRAGMDGGGHGGHGGHGGDRGPAPREMPRGIAVALVVALAALLTFVGMLSQIWANLSGAQLPGA
ncbi:MAG: hypothetical protein ACRDPK_09255 [Carbonactinosporaceae bacterium]